MAFKGFIVHYHDNGQVTRGEITTRTIVDVENLPSVIIHVDHDGNEHSIGPVAADYPDLPHQKTDITITTIPWVEFVCVYVSALSGQCELKKRENEHTSGYPISRAFRLMKLFEVAVPELQFVSPGIIKMVEEKHKYGLGLVDLAYSRNLLRFSTMLYIPNKVKKDATIDVVRRHLNDNAALIVPNSTWLARCWWGFATEEDGVLARMTFPQAELFAL